MRVACPQLYSSASSFTFNFNLNPILKPQLFNSTLNLDP